MQGWKGRRRALSLLAEGSVSSFMAVGSARHPSPLQLSVSLLVTQLVACSPKADLTKAYLTPLYVEMWLGWPETPLPSKVITL